MRSGLIVALLLAGPIFTQIANAETVTTLTAVPTPGQWYGSTTGAGTVGIVDISSAGGNLQNNAPLPPGAVRMTTTTGALSDQDRASVGLPGTYGTASSVINNALALSYSYYKGSTQSGASDFNAAAAPALRLSFFNQATNESVNLIYEPYWNQSNVPNTAINPPMDQWQTVSVDANNGFFWTSGGFGQPNAFGGPPVRTLAQWLTTFNPSFQNAELINISFGVGSFNRGQDDYLDNVTIGINGTSTNYNFDLAATEVPEPTSLVVWSMIACGASIYGWNRRRQTVAA